MKGNASHELAACMLPPRKHHHVVRVSIEESKGSVCVHCRRPSSQDAPERSYCTDQDLLKHEAWPLPAHTPAELSVHTQTGCRIHSGCHIRFEHRSLIGFHSQTAEEDHLKWPAAMLN